ncbi:uncharacterized protein [Dermacentor albipictus]|uniref:uncharacterized protein n=1 Tax=Dermacentor albipictus TaxID=60249 RepID=UPI0038FD0F05
MSWGSTKTNVRGKNLMGAAAAAGLAVINSGQTTFVRRGGSATVIDLTLVSERCSYEWQRAPDTAGSDHYPISLSPVRPSRGATRVYTVVRWPKFREFCAETPRGDDFFAHIAECANRASSRVAVPAGSPCPDIKLLNVRAARRRAQRRAIRSGAMSDWTLYNRLDAVCRRHARQLRRRSWARLCSSLAEPSNERRGWRVLRALLNPKTPRFPVQAIAIARGISELELAEILADAFAASAPATTAPTVVLRALYAAVFVRGEAHSNHAQAITSLCESDFTHHELQRALSRGRRCRSAPGADGITRQMLRNLDEPQRRLLLDAYNDVLHSGSLPDSWRHAVVVPVLKRGKPPHSPASYRPISLTSIPGKTMEAMALTRLQWIADARGALPPEQCGFRAHRSTADCIAVVVGTLEQARLHRQAAFLLLLDIQSAFDCLPHDTILSSVRALGVEGKLLAYIEAFLAGRTAAVRVGGTVGSPRPVSCGVPQGSVLSPFLFNLALAPIIECIPKTGRFPVRAVLYADDIALFVRGPTSATAAMRNQLQAALDIVANFLRAIGLRLSSTKSEAILIHPRSVRRQTGCVLVDGVPLPWRLTVRYLGLTIDSRLSWLAAVSRLRAEMRRVESAVRALLARGDGCSASFAAAIYSAVALPKVLYALPLCRVSARLWKLIDGDHRRVLRMCHGLPRSSRVAETLAETGAWPVSLTADLRALGHIERLSRAPDAGPILSLLRSLRLSGVGKVCELFDSLVVDTPPVPPSWPPPHQRAPLHVRLDLPGVRSKHRTPLCAVQQEAAAMIVDDLGGRTHLYADGSVLGDGSAAAACVAPDLGVSRQCRLSYRASSTTAELAGLHLAADILEESPHITSAAILCDSRAALQQLLLDERGPPLAQRLACRLHALQPSCDLRLQWIPSHVGVAGNETADQLARRAHNPSTALTARVRDVEVRFEYRGVRVKLVRVFGYPADLPDQALVSELEVFGKVHGISEECVPGFPAVGTGNRRIRIEMARPVPNLLRVGERVVQCEYEGVVRLCRRCNLAGHHAAACDAPQCARCAQFGHASCDAACVRCGGDHAVSACSVRTYSSVTARPEQQKPAVVEAVTSPVAETVAASEEGESQGSLSMVDAAGSGGDSVNATEVVPPSATATCEGATGEEAEAAVASVADAPLATAVTIPGASEPLTGATDTARRSKHKRKSRRAHRAGSAAREAAAGRESSSDEGGSQGSETGAPELKRTAVETPDSDTEVPSDAEGSPPCPNCGWGRCDCSLLSDRTYESTDEGSPISEALS